MFGKSVRNDMIQRAFPGGVSAGIAMPGMIGGYGGGTFNMDGTQATPVQQMPQQPRGRGKTRQLAGIFADFAAGLAGREGPYAQMLQRENYLRDQEVARQRARADEFADFQQRETWKRNNPTPVNNDTFADYQLLMEKLGPEAANKFLQNRADPPRYVQGPDGQFYPVQTAQAPTAPVGRLTPIDGGPGGVPSGAGFPGR